RIRRALHEHGLGRHSESQIYTLAADDIDSVAAVLADKPYFFGDIPRRVDAVVYAFMANVIEVPYDTPIQRAARRHTNLVRYCQRMSERYYSGKR
ncbi:MAG: glutathione S-transferase C-terminal domain-containing protein, partial [Gammaproteobacteria bacterium]|nr:glutathione S-transferase C-terminal domain-containing protein [Gammaproteobacteria bacterium]